MRASYAIGQWTPWLRVTADKERRDDESYVTATPLTLAAIGSSYDIPAYRPDTSFTTAALGINGLVTDRIAVSVAYFRVSGRSQVKEDGISGMVSIRF